VQTKERSHNIFLMAILLTLSFSLLPAFNTLRENHEKFMSIGLLNEEHLAKDFFPNNTSAVSINETLKWLIYFYNGMGEDIQIIIKVKLRNSTIDPPNDLNKTPSSGKMLLDLNFSAKKNETLLLPFVWSVTNASFQRGLARISEMRINNKNVDLNLTSDSNHFCIVFEVWLYDKSLDTFAFQWDSGKEIECIWIQKWFRIAPL